MFNGRYFLGTQRRDRSNGVLLLSTGDWKAAAVGRDRGEDAAPVLRWSAHSISKSLVIGAVFEGMLAAHPSLSRQDLERPSLLR